MSDAPSGAPSRTGPTGWPDPLSVGVGGAVGTLLRFAVDVTIGDVGALPAGILVVNLSGAFLLGVLVPVLASHPSELVRGRLRLLLGTGLLGGYTTYSALAVDTAGLLLDGEVAIGAGYALVTVVAGSIVSWAGVLVGRTIGDRR